MRGGPGAANVSHGLAAVNKYLYTREPCTVG